MEVILAMLRIEPLSEGLVNMLSKYLMQDYITNIFVLEDLYDLERRRRSEFYLALRDDEVEGFLLIYKGPHYNPVWVRGTREAASKLAELIRIERAWITADLSLADVIKGGLNVTSEVKAQVMTLRRDEERLFIHHNVEKLNEGHAEALFKTFLESEFPPPSPPKSVEEVREALRRADFYGVILNGRIASFVSCRRSPLGMGHIGLALTHPEYRKRGLATSVISRAIQELFKDQDVKLLAYSLKATICQLDVFTRRLALRFMRTSFSSD